MNASQISSASTAELLAFFNANAAKPVARFSDRRTAERRVLALVESISTISDFATHKTENCPHCGVHLSNGIGEHGDDLNGKPVRHDKFQFVCLGCGEEFGPAIRRAAPASEARSAGVAASWCDKTVRAKRCERTSVLVRGPKGFSGQFKSVASAFRAIGLPQGKIISFRMSLKAEGKLSFADYAFTVA